LDGNAAESASAQEQVKRLTGDIAHVTEDLRREQDRSNQLEKQRVSLEVQTRDLQSRLEEVEAAAIKGNRKFAQKLEQRIAELEGHLDADLRRYEEAQKTIKKLDRRVKEVLSQIDEEQKTKVGLVENVDALQQKVKTLKRQVEEAEEVATINLAKYRKAQQDLQDAEERATDADSILCKLRAKTRNPGSASISNYSPLISKKSRRGPGGIELDDY
jgi:chromosome segregation ATPase